MPQIRPRYALSSMSKVKEESRKKKRFSQCDYIWESDRRQPGLPHPHPASWSWVAVKFNRRQGCVYLSSPAPSYR